MLRLSLIELAIFSIPFVLFFTYRGFILRHRRTDGASFDPAPYHRLFILGGVLALGSFLFLALQHKTGSDEGFVPSHLENGKVIQGTFTGSDSKARENPGANHGTDKDQPQPHDPANPS